MKVTLNIPVKLHHRKRFHSYKTFCNHFLIFWGKNFLRFINRVISTCLSIFRSIWPYLEIFIFTEISEFQLLSLITENRERNSKIGFRFLLRLYKLSTYPSFHVKWSITVLKTRISKTPKIATLTAHNFNKRPKLKKVLPIFFYVYHRQ